jgi:hypothetical protein
VQTIWLSPTDYVTGDPTLRLSYPFVSHPGTVLSCTVPGDFKWVSMGLLLPPHVKIDEVIICYEVSNPQSFISQVRLVEMTAPNQATVRHDDPTDLKSTSPTCYSSKVAEFTPTAALTLELRLNFQNTTDEISLGAVGLTFRQIAEDCVNSIGNLKALDPGTIPCLTVLGYNHLGDGGGGAFFWDGSFNVDLNIWPNGEDGGTVIRPNGLQPSQAGRWRRIFSGGVSVKWFGAVGDGATDDTDAIQTAENAVAAVGGIVFFPPGIYIINGAKTTIPGDTRKYGIEKKSNTRWIGHGLETSILKLRNNSTSSLSGSEIDPQMVYANAPLNDIGFYRLAFDLNGANNPLSTLANVAAIWFNGEQLEVNGMVVDGCKFYNGPGATVILIQNRATSWSGYPLDDVLILNNRFEDNCLSPATTDHSTMNIWARHTRVIGNIFQETAAVPTLQRYSVAAAIEFHGADGLFLANVIRSYGSVVIASENFIEPWENLLIANNVASDLGGRFAATEVGTGPDTKPIDKIVVRGNDVAFNNDTSVGSKFGLEQVHGKPISYIEVSDNSFEMASPSAVIWPIGVSSPQFSPSASYTTHLKVSGNTFNKMEFGVWVDNSNLYDQVKNLEYVNNTCLNMQDLNATNAEAAGLWADAAASQHIENLVVTGNRFINEADNAGYKYGIVLGFNIDNLYLGADNVFYNIKTRPVWERSLVFNSRGPVIEESSVWDPGNIGARSLVSIDVTVTGAALGDLASASFGLDVQDLVLAAAVTAANTVTVTLTNNTASGVNLNQGTLFVKVTKKVFS